MMIQKKLTGILFYLNTKNLGHWATFTKQSDEFIGCCGLMYSPELDESDLSYRFIKSAWGKGFATEASAQTLKYGSKTYN